MRMVVLVAIALVQMAFLAAAFLFLVWRRLAHDRRMAQRAQERTLLADRIKDVQAGRLAPDEFVAGLSRHHTGVVATALQAEAARLRGPTWSGLTAAVRASPWFTWVMRHRARSRFWWRRLVAARLLVIVGDERDVPDAVRLVADRHPVVRLAAVQLVRQLPYPALIEAALEQAIEAPRVARQHHFDALAAVRDPLAPILLRRLQSPAGAYELRAMLTLAGQVSAPELLEPLLGYGESQNTDARTQVARALGAYTDPRALAALLRLLRDPKWEVRTQAASSLGILGAADAREGLSSALRDDNWWVRLRAAVALRQLGSSGLGVLIEAQAGTDRFAGEMASYVLSLSDEAVRSHAA